MLAAVSLLLRHWRSVDAGYSVSRYAEEKAVLTAAQVPLLAEVGAFGLHLLSPMCECRGLRTTSDDSQKHGIAHEVSFRWLGLTSFLP